MTKREFAEALPEAFAMWQDSEPHAPGMRMGHVKTPDFEQGTPSPKGVPPTIDLRDL